MFFTIVCVFYCVGDWDDLQIELHVSLHDGFKIQFTGIVPVFLEFNVSIRSNGWKWSFSKTPKLWYGIKHVIKNGGRTYHFRLSFTWFFFKPNSVSSDQPSFAKCLRWLPEEAYVIRLLSIPILKASLNHRVGDWNWQPTCPWCLPLFAWHFDWQLDFLFS